MSRRRSHAGVWVGQLASLAAGLLLSFTGLPSLASASSATNTSFSVSLYTSGDPVSPQFWGINVQAQYNLSIANDSGYLGSTPAKYLRFPGGGHSEGYNYTTNVIHRENGVTFVPQTSIQAFVRFCQRISCHAILELPLEINSPSTAAYFVSYVEKNLSFHPAFWEIGNEPANWVEFNVTWSLWGKVNGSTVSPSSIAHAISNYIPRIRAVDTKTPLLGLGGVGTSNLTVVDSYVTALASTVGTKLFGISVHLTPDSANVSTGAQFFAGLNSNLSVSNQVKVLRNGISSTCTKAGCARPQLVATEFREAQRGRPVANFVQNFSGALFVAVMIEQGLVLNLTSMDLFSYNLFFANATVDQKPLTPTFYLYKDIFPKLGTHLFHTQTRTSVGGLYGLATYTATVCQLLVVNTNSTRTAVAAKTSLGIPVSNKTTFLRWTNSSTQPSQFSPGNLVNFLPYSLELVISPCSPSTVGPILLPTGSLPTGAYGAGSTLIGRTRTPE